MLFLLLCFAFPFFASGQWGTPPPIVTNQLCQEEYEKIIDCVRSPVLLTTNMPRADSSVNQEIIDEVTHILDCSGFLNCNSSRILQSMFFNQRWILDHYQDQLQPCVTMEALSNIESTCLTEPLTGNCNDYTENLKCRIETLKKQPNCGSENVHPYVRFLWALRSGCVMKYQWRVEAKNYRLELNEKF